MTADGLSDVSSGLITAIGFPLSVNTTSFPAFTALMAFENR
jgi:hypothetical protein